MYYLQGQKAHSWADSIVYLPILWSSAGEKTIARLKKRWPWWHTISRLYFESLVFLHHDGWEAVLERTCKTETMKWERSQTAWTENGTCRTSADVTFHILYFDLLSVFLTATTQSATRLSHFMQILKHAILLLCASTVSDFTFLSLLGPLLVLITSISS